MELRVSNRTIIRIVLIVAALVMGLRALAILHTQLIWIVTALFLALALEPAVNLLSRYLPKRSRGLAVLIVLLVALAIVGFILFALVPPSAKQTITLVTNLPHAYSDLLARNPGLAQFIDSNVSSTGAGQAVQQFSNQLLSFGGSAVTIASSVFGGILAFVTILLLTFLMVLEGPRWVELIWRHLPITNKQHYQGLLKQMHGTITGYVNGNLLTSLIAAVATLIMLVILRSPFALALALLVGLVDLIPLVGATLAAVVVTLVVLAFKGMTAGLILAAFFLIYQQVENNWLQPIVYSKTVEVSPLIVTLALIIGASLAGFIGALVAIPAAASLQILLRDWLKDRAVTKTSETT
jgi:predicted PurR-regulated permease PerM